MMTTLRLHAIQLRHRCCGDPDTYFAVNLLGRIVLLGSSIILFVTTIVALSEKESLLNLGVLLSLTIALLTGLFLYLYSSALTAHTKYSEEQYRTPTSAINHLNPGRDHRDRAIGMHTLVYQWIPIPITQERKKAFIHAGIGPEEAITEPMTSWTIDDINVYAALNMESLSC